jgi:hypothetical protein
MCRILRTSTSELPYLHPWILYLGRSSWEKRIPRSSALKLIVIMPLLLPHISLYYKIKTIPEEEGRSAGPESIGGSQSNGAFNTS